MLHKCPFGLGGRHPEHGPDEGLGDVPAGEGHRYAVVDHEGSRLAASPTLELVGRDERPADESLARARRAGVRSPRSARGLSDRRVGAHRLRELARGVEVGAGENDLILEKVEYCLGFLAAVAGN